MAFELPDHLPRGGLAQDRPTQVLTNIGQATHKTLIASLAASWLAELDSTIHDTKTRISRRIHDDFPAFERQLKSSESIQTRLGELSTTVNGLADSLNNPKTGILPTLLQTLTAHGILSEQTKDSEVTHHALAHLLHIQEELRELSTRVQQGELPESAQASVRVQRLVTEAPGPLGKADIMSGIKKKYRTLNDRLQEQLTDAYSRSVLFSSSVDTVTLTILSSTNVPPTSTVIDLPAILHALAPDSLSTRLTALRRDLMAKLVDSILLSSSPITACTSDSSSRLSLSLSSTSSSPLQSLKTLMTFLDSHFFPHLPPAQALSFPATFHAPITNAVLTNLLKSSIPATVPALPSYLATLDEAIGFEESLLPTETRDRPIRYWADDVAGHYEKKRRENLLQTAREIVSGPEDGTTFRTEVTIKQPPGSPARSAIGEADSEASAWNFDDEKMEDNADASTSRNTRLENGPHADAHALTVLTQDPGETFRDGRDASDSWGWGDDADTNDADPPRDGLPQAEALNPEGEDDLWDDDGWSAPPEPKPDPKPSPVPKLAPKMATRLEKFSAKAKGLSAPTTPVASSVSSHPSPSLQAQPSPRQKPPRPPKKKLEENETYLVSARARKVLEIAEDVMREGQELLHSDVFTRHLSGKTVVPGQLLIAAAPSVLDLHRALYPIAHSSILAQDLNLAMRWANDCRFLSDEVARLKHFHGSADDGRWVEVGNKLQTLGELGFEDVVGLEQEAVQNLLIGAQGFVDVSSNERFEECKGVVEGVLHEITTIAYRWKETLPKSGYLNAVGQVVDDVLYRMMDDIMCLEDIPEADSERLSELCELLAPLEELFVYAPSEQSVVGSHVPLWFKFSYLSWLIKGSIADLSYLFDQGMLIDYEIDELVRLLRALFAETPLRENTIVKIVRGHPVPGSGVS